MIFPANYKLIEFAGDDCFFFIMVERIMNIAEIDAQAFFS